MPRIQFSRILVNMMFVFAVVVGFSGCASTPDQNLVTARLAGPGVSSPTNSVIYTQPAGQGVQITSSAGGGRNPAALSGPEVVRLINRMEARLSRWSRFAGSDPFEETIMIGLAGTTGPQPFTVKLAKGEGMDEPVFLVTLAYQEAVATMALDRANARKWIAQLRGAINY